MYTVRRINENGEFNRYMGKFYIVYNASQKGYMEALTRVVNISGGWFEGPPVSIIEWYDESGHDQCVVGVNDDVYIVNQYGKTFQRVYSDFSSDKEEEEANSILKEVMEMHNAMFEELSR